MLLSCFRLYYNRDQVYFLDQKIQITTTPCRGRHFYRDFYNGLLILQAVMSQKKVVEKLVEFVHWSQECGP